MRPCDWRPPPPAATTTTTPSAATDVGGRPAPPTAPTGGGSGGAVDLAAVCPDPLVIQTDWFPEAEHGALYEMVGEGYEVDTEQQGRARSARRRRRRTPASTSRSAPAGRRSASSRCPSSSTPTTASTSATPTPRVRSCGTTRRRVLSVVAPLEINPQIIYWDPETYPDVETLADLGEEGVTINIFEGGTFAEVFVAEGIWQADQIDPSYDGSPARFIAEDGAIAQQGFASAEPYTYENVFEEWGKPVALPDRSTTPASRSTRRRWRSSPTELETLAPCLELFVPIVQQAAIDYINAPDRANAIIIDAVEQYDDFWIYDEGLAEYSVETQKELGFVGNGPDDTLGNMDEERVQGVIDQIRDAGIEVPEDLAAADLVHQRVRRPGHRVMNSEARTLDTRLRLTMTAAIHARFAHRVDGLVHSHPWSIEATVEGPADADKVMPADDLEAILHGLVEPWRGRYLTDTDVGDWKGYRPLVWDREPTVEEIARRLWASSTSRSRGWCRWPSSSRPSSTAAGRSG